MRGASPPTSLWTPIPPETTGRYEGLTAAKPRFRRSRATTSQLCFGAWGTDDYKLSLPLWGRWPEGADEVPARRRAACALSGFKEARSDDGTGACRRQWRKKAGGTSGIARSACATMRVPRKSGDEIPRQVWAAARRSCTSHRISCIIPTDFVENMGISH